MLFCVPSAAAFRVVPTYRGVRAGGFGACEVFSLSPTKVVTAMEGGLVTTNDEVLASRLRSLRDYGKDPTNGEDMIHFGLFNSR